MNDSRCGLRCTGCAWKESHGCGGCVDTNGHPFYGECSIAVCCQDKGLAHCGECEKMPCEKLYEYSYLDPEHGDKPQGARVMQCRRWAAESGKHAWHNVLLTSAGFADMRGKQRTNIVNRFLTMLDKPAKEARVLFIPYAAIDEGAKEIAVLCRDELVRIGIRPGNIMEYLLDGSINADEAMEYDAVYFTGGDTAHLLRGLAETGFGDIAKRMVYANKVFIGVSAGSLIATPNIGDPFEKNTAGLCFVNAYLSVHCPPDAQALDLPLPHIPLTDNQALAVSWNGYEMIEG